MAHYVSDKLFEDWMRAFAGRIGRELDSFSQVALYRGVCRVVDSEDEFDAAAQYVYEHWKSWQSYPAPIDFADALAALRRRVWSETEPTLRMIDASRALALPAASRSTQLDEFHAAIERELAECPTRAPAAVTPNLREPMPSRWESDPDVVARRDRERQRARELTRGWRDDATSTDAATTTETHR